jgi:hypothetical protein
VKGIIGEWVKLYNEKVNNWFPQPRRKKWTKYVESIRQTRNIRTILVGKPECRWEDTIKVDVEE